MVKYLKNELLDAGFEIMMRDPYSYQLRTEKFSFYYTNDDDSYWKLTNNLHIDGSIHLITNNPTTSEANKGQIIYKDDKKMHFINEDGFDFTLDNELHLNFNVDRWNLSNDEETIYSFNKIGINLSDPDKQLEVNGEARIRDNLQVDNSLLLGTDGAYLKVDNDNHIYFFDKDGMRHEITNDLMDTDNDGLIPITNWNLSNDEETIYSFNKIGINLSDPDKQLEVNGEARIRDNLQVDSSLLLGTAGAYLKVDDDNHIYFFDKDGMRHEITNDLMDTDNDGLIPITNWSLSNDEETIYSFNKIGINLSDPDKQLEVNGEARIRDNLQVDSSLLLGTNGAYLKVDDDNQIYFFDKDGMRHEITNDLMDTDNDGLIPITNWNLSNDEETIYSFNKIGINLSNPDKQLEVNGEARIRDTSPGR